MISQRVATSSPSRSNKAAPARPVGFLDAVQRGKGDDEVVSIIYSLPLLKQLVLSWFLSERKDQATLQDFQVCPSGMALRSLRPLI